MLTLSLSAWPAREKERRIYWVWAGHSHFLLDQLFSTFAFSFRLFRPNSPIFKAGNKYMGGAADIVLQVGILLLTLAMFIAIQYFPKKALSNLRAKNRTTIQANRHILRGTQFLSRAKATQSHALAKNALAESEAAISLSPKDPAPLILKAVALDFLGQRGSALRSLDLALSFPRVKSLSGRERGDALVKRAELKLAVNRRRRVDSAVEDLKEAVELGSEGEKGYCLLGQCCEWKGMKEDAKWAFEQALRIHPGSSVARQGLNRLGS